MQGSWASEVMWCRVQVRGRVRGQVMRLANKQHMHTWGTQYFHQGESYLLQVIEGLGLRVKG